MSNVLKMAAVGGAVSAETDPNFKQTVLLLHGDGTNGAQNNTFLDSSTNNFTITRNGNTTQGTFSPFSLAAGEWSNYFNGSSGFLSFAANSAFDVTQGNFTIEAWVYRNASGSQHYLFSQRFGNGWELRINSDNTLQGFYVGGTSITSTTTVPANEWVHVCWVRSGSTTSLYINGTRGNTGSISNGTSVTSSLRVGYSTDPPAGYMNGYISNARIVKGTAVYDPTQTTITVPTAPLTAITNTSLLTCQSNRFVDNSTNAFAITRNGDVRVTPFSPFAPSAAYSASTNGGSGYFDGTGDYLSNSSNAFIQATGDFTVEMWVYVSNLSTTQYFFSVSSTSNLFEIYVGTGGQIGVQTGTAAFRDTNNGLIKPMSWNYVAVTRSGNTYTTYVNGVNESYAASAGTMLSTLGTTPTGIGARSGGGNLITGFIAGLRVSNNVRTGLTSIPTAPYANDGNTTLLLNFTNAGIFDNTGKNNLETVGNAQIDTTTKKFGTGSMEFDGTGDYLTIPSSPNLAFDSGPYTIEFWVNPSSLSATLSHIVGANATNGIVVLANNAKVALNKFGTGDVLAYNTPLSTSVWTHVAVVREGTGSNQTKIYINGTAQATGTDNNSWTVTTNFGIGANTASNTQTLTGYIDDLRITKGVARYTANFTAPTKAFPDQ